MRVTLRDVYEEIVALRETVKDLPTRAELDRMETRINHDVESIEIRVRTNEMAIAATKATHPPRQQLSPWSIAGVLITGLVAIGGFATLMITLIEKVAA